MGWSQIWTHLPAALVVQVERVRGGTADGDRWVRCPARKKCGVPTADDTSLAIESEEQGKRDAWLNELITLDFQSSGHDTGVKRLRKFQNK